MTAQIEADLRAHAERLGVFGQWLAQPLRSNGAHAFSIAMNNGDFVGLKIQPGATRKDADYLAGKLAAHAFSSGAPIARIAAALRAFRRSQKASIDRERKDRARVRSAVQSAFDGLQDRSR